MAEVPEVEIIVRDLREAVVGQEFAGATIYRPECVLFPAVEVFPAVLAGQQILDANRRAKFILLSLTNDLMLSVHFMLWGTLRLKEGGLKPPPETLVVFHLVGNDDLLFTDKLGYARTALGPPDVLAERLDLTSLGPEALDPAFDGEVLRRQLFQRRGVLKSLLLNQRVLAGLGNRDADESLWLAGIDPRRAAPSLTGDEIDRLASAVVSVLNEGIALRGTQRDLFGQPGKARHRRNVFERTGVPCPRCRTPIAHTRIGGRNTHFCPGCQH